MNVPTCLAATSGNPGWEFPPEEYRRRVDGARCRMAAPTPRSGSVRPGPGMWSCPSTGNRWRSSPPPMCWDFDTRAGSPTSARGPADDGVSLVVEALRACVRPGGRLGAELGAETRLEMPVGDFLRIRDALEGVRFDDARLVLRPLRMVK